MHLKNVIELDFSHLIKSVTNNNFEPQLIFPTERYVRLIKRFLDLCGATKF